MSEPFIAEIRMFGGNFTPRGWAFCNGQLLAIAQNQALFSILGTTYGGDGRTSFGLPDLRGRCPVHAGQGPGLSNRPLGSAGGQEAVALNANQMPSHSHGLNAQPLEGDSASPTGRTWAKSARGAPDYGSAEGSTSLSPDAMSAAGGGQAHDNMPPFRAVNYIIALVGIFPSE